ncbi:hypothetical protein [Archangium sp.]|uniref:hypothetical protein n=1 Tax=Archangium sp. TaxID=1872627 RepID=UPI00286BFEA9|nr:hypothetical protein [Archangium sp.]
MKRLTRCWGAVALAAAVVAPLSAGAQPRGRTDGPEGSEYGKGGYSRSSDSRFSLELNWGAAFAARISELESQAGPPLFVGATASLWGADWYQFDFSGAYVLHNGQVNVLVGPRFRTYGAPVSLYAGFKAGAFFVPDEGLRFGLSPQAGVDMFLANERVVLGLGYALDIPIARRGLTNRLFMNVGYRF